jgi:hypothetical protein
MIVLRRPAYENGMDGRCVFAFVRVTLGILLCAEMRSTKSSETFSSKH